MGGNRIIPGREAGHPNVAYPLDGLATLYLDQGKYEQAELRLQRALHFREQALGALHLKTTETRTRLITLLRAMGQEGSAHPSLSVQFSSLDALTPMQRN